MALNRTFLTCMGCALTSIVAGAQAGQCSNSVRSTSLLQLKSSNLQRGVQSDPDQYPGVNPEGALNKTSTFLQTSLSTNQSTVLAGAINKTSTLLQTSLSTNQSTVLALATNLSDELASPVNLLSARNLKLKNQLVKLRKHTGSDAGRYLTVLRPYVVPGFSRSVEGWRDKLSGWALVHDQNTDDSLWELIVVDDSDGTPVVQLKKAKGYSAGRYLTAHGPHFRRRDDTSSWALAHERSDADSQWLWKEVGEQVRLMKFKGWDAGRYLTAHGSHIRRRDDSSSWALVHEFTNDDSLWDPVY